MAGSQVAPWTVLVYAVKIGLILDIFLEGTKAKEYCTTGEDFAAQCELDQVVVMETALYGRMRLGRCVDEDFGHIGCSADVLHKIDGACSGRHTCEITYMTTFLEGVVAACPKALTSYLEADYECITVVTGAGKMCHMSGSSPAPPAPGYLANVITQETGCGRQDHPWIIQAPHGQKINITIWEFTTGKTRSSITALNTNCVKYVSITEDNNREYSICEGGQRRRHAYLSQGSKIEVAMAKPVDIGGAHFMLKYEVVGCPEPDYPDYMWAKRESNHVTLGCYTSSSTWRLECRDNTWHGEVGNCDVQESEASEPKSKGKRGRGSMAVAASTKVSTLSDSVIITIAVCSAVLLSIILLVIGMIFGRRNEYPSPSTVTIPYADTNYGGHLPDESYDPTLLLKKKPPHYNCDTNPHTTKNTGYNADTMGRYLDRSLPRPPGDTSDTPPVDNIPHGEGPGQDEDNLLVSVS